MDNIHLISSIAGICTTMSFLPQVIKVYRTRHTKDLSLPMYIIFSCGVFMWMYYGYLVQSIPIMIANGITFTLSAYILVMKIRFK